jgi:hypothetical protein
MPVIQLERLSSVVSERVGPFFQELVGGYPDNIHSIHVVGSSLTQDFNRKTSDINSIVVLKAMDLKFVEFVAPLGKKYRKRGVAAPLIMTPEYITDSLDVFPIEFLDLKLIHETVFGEDILKDIAIKSSDLRNQCEREIKTKLIGLRQGYISSMGDRHMLTERFVHLIAGAMPLFRGIVYLMGKERPVGQYDVITALSSATGVNTDILNRILDITKGKIKPGKDELVTVFEELHSATEKIGKLIDEYQI